MKKTILFFGGSGFIGTYFVKKLLSLGHKVKVFDLKKPLIYHKNLSYIKGNILDKKKISKIIKKDYFVFNFAGWADLESAINNPREVIRQNVLGNSAIMDICKKKRVKRFIYASSIYVFSKYGGVYKDSKQQCEILIKKSGLNYTILRFGSIYGPGAKKGNAIYDLLNMAINKKKIIYWGKGDEVRQYIHARDAAKVCENIFSEKFKNKSILLTGLEDIRLNDLLNMINEIFNKKIKILYKYNKKSISHYKNTPFSIEKKQKYIPDISEKLVFESYTDIGQGIYECAQNIISKN
tara:strand:+ start:6145 stop:7026 length:882 start_codon:yes stop_codon:yes gene_type:complete